MDKCERMHKVFSFSSYNYFKRNNNVSINNFNSLFGVCNVPTYNTSKNSNTNIVKEYYKLLFLQYFNKPDNTYCQPNKIEKRSRYFNYYNWRFQYLFSADTKTKKIIMDKEDFYQLEVTDCIKILHPKIAEYSFFLRIHRTFCRVV